MANSIHTSIIHWENKDLFPYLLEKTNELYLQKKHLQAQPIGMIRIALNYQANASDGLFLHIWMPGLPLQATGGPFVHTHVFDLKSRILKGKIKNVIYAPQSTPKGSYKLTYALCEQDYCVLKQNVIIDRVDMQIAEERDLYPGEVYEVPKHIFHKTIIEENEIVMTLMEKSNVENTAPVLAIPYDLPISSESFDRNQLDQGYYWKKVLILLEQAQNEMLMLEPA